jgi:hypothetical protein
MDFHRSRSSGNASLYSLDDEKKAALSEVRHTRVSKTTLLVASLSKLIFSSRYIFRSPRAQLI